MIKKRRGIVAISGPFGLPHAGHFELIDKTLNYVETLGKKWQLIVIMNNGPWVKAKYGFEPVPEATRREFLKHCRGIDFVVTTLHIPGDLDHSVCRELRMTRPDIFAHGGDRNRENIPERELCNELGIEMLDGMGEKIDSSSQLLESLIKDFAKSRGIELPSEVFPISRR